MIISSLLESELIDAPKNVRQLIEHLPESQIEKIKLTEEAVQLADQYIKAKVVGKTSVEDCRHIAMATICKADVLVSWNFKHIVNVERINGYNSVNLNCGYKTLDIRTPKEYCIMKKTKKKKKSMVALLRKIRDKISSETMDMSFEELNEYFRKRREEYSLKNGEANIVAEPKAHYGKKK